MDLITAEKIISRKVVSKIWKSGDVFQFPTGGFTFTIKWTVRGIPEKAFHIGPKCDTLQQAFEMAKINATIYGWRRPKWFEYWRWFDRSYDSITVFDMAQIGKKP